MLELDICIRGAITIGGMYWDKPCSTTSSPLLKAPPEQQFGRFNQTPPEFPASANPPDVLYLEGATGFPITLGPGLIEAYELESGAAIYPRVIASSRLADYLLQNDSLPASPLTSPSPADSCIPLHKFFQTGEDGIQFLDLLHPKIDRRDTKRITRQDSPDGTMTWQWERRTTSRKEILALASSLADRRLKGKLPDAVRGKYGWLKNYALRSAQR